MRAFSWTTGEKKIARAAFDLALNRELASVRREVESMLAGRHFVIDHVWRSPAELADLRRRLMAIDANAEVRCFLLTLPADEDLRRIERRQRARAIHEREFELHTFAEERDVLAKSSDLGQPFDVSARPPELVANDAASPGTGLTSVKTRSARMHARAACTRIPSYVCRSVQVVYPAANRPLQPTSGAAHRTELNTGGAACG